MKPPQILELEKRLTYMLDDSQELIELNLCSCEFSLCDFFFQYFESQEKRLFLRKLIFDFKYQKY